MTTEDIEYKLEPKKLRAPHTNVMKTVALFYENLYGKFPKHEDRVNEAVFTIAEHDKHGLPSFHRLYLEINDPTEYMVGQKLFGSIEHWEKIKKNKTIRPVLKKAREALTARIKAEAMSQIDSIARCSEKDATRLQALKFMHSVAADSVGKNPTTNKGTKRGRPSKEEVEGNLKNLTEDERRMEEEFNRVLGIVTE